MVGGAHNAEDGTQYEGEYPTQHAHLDGGPEAGQQPVKISLASIGRFEKNSPIPVISHDVSLAVTFDTGVAKPGDVQHAALPMHAFDLFIEWLCRSDARTDFLRHPTLDS